MTPIDGRRNPKGDKWAKPLPKGSVSGRKGGGCLRVLLPGRSRARVGCLVYPLQLQGGTR